MAENCKMQICINCRSSFYFWISYRNFALVRADVSRLPFASSAVDAVHAGAALHCWPSPSNAVLIIFSYCLFIFILIFLTFPCIYANHQPVRGLYQHSQKPLKRALMSDMVWVVLIVITIGPGREIGSGCFGF